MKVNTSYLTTKIELTHLISPPLPPAPAQVTQFNSRNSLTTPRNKFTSRIGKFCSPILVLSVATPHAFFVRYSSVAFRSHAVISCTVGFEPFRMGCWFVNSQNRMHYLKTKMPSLFGRRGSVEIGGK